MKSLVTLFAVFAVGVGGLAVLDRDDRLPELYTGTPASGADEPPPPRWYTIDQPISATSKDGMAIQVSVALQLPKRLPAFVRDGDAAGRLEQEPVVRAIVTDTVMQRPGSAVATAEGRRRLERVLRRRIRAHTDVRVRRVVIPDVVARG